MSPPPPWLPADLPLGQALESRLNGHAGEAFPVMEDGHVIGLVSLSTAAGVPPDRPVRDATVNPGTTLEANPDEALTDLAARLGDRPASAVLVVEAGRLVGVVEPGDLDRFFRRVR
jgi:CBS domain-containing protein